MTFVPSPLKLLKKFSAPLIMGCLLSAFLLQFNYYFLDSAFYDLFFRITPQTKETGQVKIIEIGRDFLEARRGEPRFAELNYVIQRVLEQNPVAVAYIGELKNTEGSLLDKEEFLYMINAHPNVFWAKQGLIPRAELTDHLLPPPLHRLKPESATISIDKVNFAADEVSRRAVVRFEDEDTLHLKLAKLMNTELREDTIRGAFDFSDTKQIYTDFRRSGTYKKMSFKDILDYGKAPANLAGRIVLIGRTSDLKFEDYARVPFDRNPIAMSKLDIHASIIDTLITNKGVIKAPQYVANILTVIVALLTTWIVFTLTPAKGILALLATTFGLLFIGFAGFGLFRFYLAMAHPLVAIFISYYFFIPYRLIREARKSWEYQQKNRLLTQVEELKTNFLSMMSHDLKTPLARIQGMADMALRHPDNLTPEQTKALETINASTEELTTFISSILDLGRIESEHVKLHTQPKDINALLSEVIEKYQYSAKTKNIEIIKEFEPLFSTKIDPDLMKQVFSNLIENAIKYSPEGSKVLVTTEEVDNHIQVQVADQGIGISPDEIGNVFMKFYRSKDAKNSPIKGTGLGLFLAKYFVELHKGHISVESVPRQGSTFTVDLPMN